MIDALEALEKLGKFQCHPLGFYYLSQQLTDSACERFHIWLTRDYESEESQTNICHQHSFDLESHILVGELKNNIFKFKPNTNGSVLELSVTYENNKSQLNDVQSRGELPLICSFHSMAGQSYYLKAGVVHSATVVTAPCVTSLTTTEKGVAILSYGTNPEEPPFERRFINCREKLEIRGVLAALVGNGTG